MNQSHKSNKKKNKRQTPSLIKPQDVDNAEHNIWSMAAICTGGKTGVWEDIKSRCMWPQIRRKKAVWAPWNILKKYAKEEKQTKRYTIFLNRKTQKW